MKDALDLLAYKLYLADPGCRGAAGFHPPERPDGWLDETEAAVWGRWRQKAAAAGGEVTA